MTPAHHTTPCNCTDSTACPLDGHCQQKAIVYKASVKTDDTEKEYIGCSETAFKLRLANHKQNFRNKSHCNKTRLSQYVWGLKDCNTDFSLSWKIQARSNGYICGSRKCDLCLVEKFEILKSNPSISLNKRSEIANKCRHNNKFKLKNIK